jgi:Holliday junction resolvase-like predicted endonuclease
MKRLCKSSDRWYLITESGESVAVRDIFDGKRLAKNEAESVTSSQSADMWPAASLFLPGDLSRTPATQISVTRLDDWKAIARAIDAGEFRKSTTGTAARTITVPITPLRDVCALLRELAADSVWERLARKWVKRPERLARLFLRAVADFEEYENDESFLPIDRSGDFVDANDGLGFARGLARYVSKTGGLTLGAERLAFVAYELSPRRTTGASFEGDDEQHLTGSSSGGGGLDLLLATENAFVVVEVKAKSDTSLLLALVQALMYTAELVPEAQRRRLATHHASQLAFLQAPGLEGPFVDVLLLYETPSPHGDDVEMIQQIAVGLLRSSGLDAARLRQYVRRIVLVGGKLVDGAFEMTSRVDV